MLPVNDEALQWLRLIRLTLITRKVRVGETVKYPLSAEGHRNAQRAKPGISATEKSTPDEVITRELARASKIAVRFLRQRGLEFADRQDILHDAILWCLENRNNYSLTTTLETWFINAVRNMYQRYRRHQARMVYGDISMEASDGVIQQDD